MKDTVPPKSDCSTNDPLPNVTSILVTGCAGFIGGWFARMIVHAYGNHYRVIGFDNLESCASLNNLASIDQHPAFCFVKGDICNFSDVMAAMKHHKVDAVVHFAARSHVDQSFSSPLAFTTTNIVGTQVLLEAAKTMGCIQRFVYVSTDEVYGENDADRCFAFTENQPLNPTNPYAASKAAAEMIVRAYEKSFGLPVIITRCNNVFGPYQHPEKMIPKFITSLMKGKKMTLHGNGTAVRSFVFAADAVTAFDLIFHCGELGVVYNISSRNHFQVREVAVRILEYFPQYESQGLAHWAEMVVDRPFNDKMYWTDDSRLRALGWTEKTDFEEGLDATVKWYTQHAGEFWGTS
ncbi:dTDP-D-glucose 4,6-dehydratase [Aspergillus indologenus CBS 114.80]|uniref:dTDP-D-glucose 4,6-dehydratase n=1 Tax=Aspergillus indologenus CBS 114.80 TaxID=1450541 RepID=A0A2V5ICD6_9EURO|nr:dTDP-D-glucose 4,6-dehydratase [Aspergillus indologenus CBS 114.80]